MARPKRPLADRFAEKVPQGLPTDVCWPWQGTIKGGAYGVLHRDGRGTGQVYAHRVAYELAYGPIPAEFQVNHHCDNKRCVNPGHLYAGTAAENARDFMTRGDVLAWKARTRRPGEANGRAKVTAGETRIMRQLRRDWGVSAETIGTLYGVQGATVRKVLTRTFWVYS
jgi:hypothetical protein